jgi:DNA-dependent metalloprotease WSS1
VHGPHDAKFHALWNQLRDEHEGLTRKGYSGEGFLSDGHRLGGGRVPMHEARRLARAAAEKRRVLSSGSGQKLGGNAPRPGQDIRRVILSAVERRNATLQGCGNEKHDEQEIRKISETATRNGFKTKAEEDAANEAAIAQALWELVQEDEKAKYGSSYVPPSAQNPEGNGGGVYMPNEPSNKATQPAGLKKDGPPADHGLKASKQAGVTSAELERSNVAGWTCEVCTLHNADNFLMCDACGTERPKSSKRPNTGARPVPSSQRPVGGRLDGADGPLRQSASVSTRAGPALPVTEVRAFWKCAFCGNFMEREVCRIFT